LAGIHYELRSKEWNGILKIKANRLQFCQRVVLKCKKQAEYSKSVEGNEVKERDHGIYEGHLTALDRHQASSLDVTNFS
jgi:hypothetical protein